MTNNPLIAKWEELHNPKKEEPKKVEDEPSFKDKLKELRDISTVPVNAPNIITKANHIPSLITYDRQSGEDSFLQIAEKIKNKNAKVTSVSINANAVGGFNTGVRTYTFEVMEWDI
jgi:hypothetical protein